ncbi:MAG: hypothetical protein RJB01_1057, partial [Actinomycetota bacterium]
MEDETAVGRAFQGMYHRKARFRSLVEVEAGNNTEFKLRVLNCSGDLQDFGLDASELAGIVVDFHPLKRALDEGIQWKHAQDRSHGSRN